MELQLQYEKNQYHNIVVGPITSITMLWYWFFSYWACRPACRLGKEMTTRCLLKSSESRKARTRGIW